LVQAGAFLEMVRILLSGFNTRMDSGDHSSLRAS